jgi:hypothetical protein
MGPTVAELVDFAKAHNLLLHDRVTPEEFEDMLRDGCFHFSGRSCPCEDAANLHALADSGVSPEFQTCAGSVFITQAHKDFFDNSDSVAGSDIEVTPEMQNAAREIIGTLDQAEDLVNHGEHDAAIEVLQEEAGSSECGSCKQILETEALRIQLVDQTCKGPDGNSCDVELKRLHERYGELRKMEKEITELPEDEVSPYRVCMSDTYADAQIEELVKDLPDKSRHRAKLAVKAKMCGKAQLSPESAFAEYKNKHPEIFA